MALFECQGLGPGSGDQYPQRPFPAVLEFVDICHPGFTAASTDTLPVLLSFPAIDHKPEDVPIHYGASHRLILDAGRIITNEDTFLALDADGNSPLPEAQALVPPGSYFLHLHAKRGRIQYSIYKNFNLWPFPPRIPPHWCRNREASFIDLSMQFTSLSASKVSVNVKSSDRRWVVTGTARW